MNEKEFKSYKRDIIRKMKAVGTYNKSFEHSIDVLAKTLVDYKKAVELHEKTGGNLLVKHTNKNGSTNLAKHPLYLAIEKLRDDILAYSRELGLTPSGLKRIKDEVGESKQQSPLEKILSEMS